MRLIPSHWLGAYVFALTLAAGAWVGGRGIPLILWLMALALVAGLWKWPFPLELPDVRARVGARDVVLALAIAGPSIVNLAATWRQEFPTSGDQWAHNGYGLEAYAFWWPWPWLAAFAALLAVALAVRRNSRSPLPIAGFVFLVLLAMVDVRALFAGRYPALLHFISVPFRALIPVPCPMDIERLLNTGSILAWLLVLRPRLLGRRVDTASTAVGMLLFWQKDVVYYMTSGYLEPWALVLLLTAAEHLLRFGRTAVWRPFLLLGAAALVKDQAILTLPVVAVVFFPREKRLPYVAVVAASCTPFLLWAARAGSNVRRGSGLAALSSVLGEHATLWRERVGQQFGVALPLVVIAVLALVVLAFRNRAGLALLLAALLDAGIFFCSAVQQPWPGHPRTNLVPLAYAALALGLMLEPLGRKAWFAVAAIVTLNAIPLIPFLDEAFAPSDARNFFEHRDAAIYFPIREALEGQRLLAPGSPVDVLYNGRRLYSFYYLGLPSESYPDLASRYRMRVQSFAGAPERCQCTASEAKLGVFIRFNNLGAARPERAAIEAEAAQCRAFIEATCRRTMVIRHGDTVVGLLGVGR